MGVVKRAVLCALSCVRPAAAMWLTCCIELNVRLRAIAAISGQGQIKTGDGTATDKNAAGNPWAMHAEFYVYRQNSQKAMRF